MPAIYEYHCSDGTCDSEGPEGWRYYMYAIADDGERVTCPHPGERAVARTDQRRERNERRREYGDFVRESFALVG